MRPWAPVVPFLLLFVAGCFPQKAGPRLAHFETQSPAVGEVAPSFELTSLRGERVALADLVGEKPIVLQFGSHSCPVYRYRRHWMEGLAADYEGRAHFVLVYTREAHPVGSPSPFTEGEWDPWLNRLVGVRVREPQSLEERLRQAAASHEKLELGREMWVDSMDDAAWSAYGGAASPAFVLDRSGRVALRQVWVGPREIRATLDRLLGLER